MAFPLAKTYISIIIQGTNLGGGATHSLVWNNAPKNVVYGLSARPIGAQNNSSLTNKVRIQNVKASSTGNPETMKVHFEVNNWGTAWCDYFVIMSQTDFA